MSKKTFDKRIAFIGLALNRGITGNANLANNWYIDNKAKAMDNEEALRKFKEWLDDDGSLPRGQP